jgi:hypothetical protein
MNKPNGMPNQMIDGKFGERDDRSIYRVARPPVQFIAHVCEEFTIGAAVINKVEDPQKHGQEGRWQHGEEGGEVVLVDKETGETEMAEGFSCLNREDRAKQDELVTTTIAPRNGTVGCRVFFDICRETGMFEAVGSLERATEVTIPISGPAHALLEAD